MNGNKVVTFGEIMLRLTPPDYFRLSQCHYFNMNFAGAEANVAVSLANYGIESEFITRLPQNPISKKCLDELHTHRVKTNYVLEGGERLGIFYLERGSVIRPSKVYYDRKNSGFSTIKPGMFKWEKILKDATWFHWSGITPALSQSAADVCLEAIDAANKLGVTVSCDINFRKNLWDYGKEASEILPTLISKCDIIMGNEEDCEKVFGIKPNDFDVENTDGNISLDLFKDVCFQMFEKFPMCRLMALTLRGAVNANFNTWQGVLCSKNKFYKSKKYNITHIVDRVGSGDAFSGGLIYGLLMYGEDYQKALDFAVAASCLKHTISGDFNTVSIEEVIDLLDGNYSGRVQR